MQTFLPFPDLRASSQVLDSPRLGKQRVETFQILRALTWPEYAWKNHPAVRMWRGFVPALVAYGVENCREWVRRGHRDTVLPQLLAWTGGEVPADPELPPWWGRADLHLSHRARLVHKDPDAYLPVFGPLADLPYVWPDAPFPSWPLRRGDRDVDVDGAAAVLGVVPHAWQREATEAVRAGRDVLLVAAPGSGGTTAALLAGLAVPGPTLRVLPGAHPPPEPVPPVLLTPAGAAPVDGEEPTPPAGTRVASDAARDATAAEARAPEWHLRGPEAVTPELVGAAGLVTWERAAPAPVLPADRPPVLAVVSRADAAQRADTAARLGLRAPLHVGGGWDVGARLDAALACSVGARRAALVEAVRGGRGALVVARDRGRADRAVGTLAAAGLRAALWSPTLRASRAQPAVAAWRSRRLDALVVPEGALPPLGRAGVRRLVGLDAPVSLTAWRDLVAAVDPREAVLLAGPDGSAELQAWAAGSSCLRAGLLAPFGEPVPVPCGRCTRCG